jgi:hypothetical protein
MTTKLWLPLCCMVLAITACSGGTQVPPVAPADGPSAEREVAPNALGEVLSARKVVVKTRLCGAKGSSAVVTFTARGAAKGPYKGTFTATGSWNFTRIPGNDIWTFSEKYVIKTGAGLVDGTITGSGQKIKSTCKAFGPATGKANLKFTLGQKSGSATTSIIRSGSLEEHLN